MADIDIDPFGEHESRPEEPTDEHIPLDPVTPERSSTWEPRDSKMRVLAQTSTFTTFVACQCSR